MKRIGHNSKVGTVLLTDRRDFIPMDRSAYSQTLTNVGSTWQLDGRGYDGTDDYIDCGNAASLNTPKGVTVSFKVKLTDVSTLQSFLTKSNEYVVGLTNTGLLRGDVNVTGFTWQNTNDAIPINQPHYITMQWNGSIIIFYINGVSVHTFNEAGTITATANPLLIGIYSVTVQPTSGTIAKVSTKNFAEYSARIQRSTLIGGLRGRDGMRRVGG